MKILFVGDIVGSLGRKKLSEWLPKLKEKYKPQATIANGENAADGRGITEKNYKEILQSGVDLVTLGNHTWDKREIFDFINDAKKMIRPANYPQSADVPGRGIAYIKINQLELAVINLHGRSFMGEYEDPFRVGGELVKEAAERTKHIFIDFHAEATSEKEAIGWFMDGQVSAVIGTHTHVQTNDGRILPKGTAYLTDVGMTGFYDGILGMKKEPILHKFTTQLPQRFELPSRGRSRLNACLIEIDDQTGKAKKIETIRIDDDMTLFEL
ncbi:TIGR00282 family metallophosphoesterase [Alkalibacterium kapii]|uniref:Metallophosphoesterase n=1 Tax=Alkalibacterium kapii TaxID=426704 RepID=A0A511AUW4_9LACT|nr:TIGR00282 family metallophosphoesterase [Alkalibacterium kapii]GEK91472.1 metallophosphoesterase [Alkalibacterium kapii]